MGGASVSGVSRSDAPRGRLRRGGRGRLGPPRGRLRRRRVARTTPGARHAPQAPGSAASRGVRHRHARPAGPTHRDAPRRPRGASDHDSLRSRASRAHSACHDLPTRDGSLRFDQSARQRPSVWTLRPLGRNGAYRIRDEPKGLTGGQGSIPIWIRLRWMRNRLSGHCNYRAASHGSTPCARDDVAMTSSDVAPRSQHPATLRVRFACSIVSTRMLRVNDRHASLLFKLGGLQGGLGPPCSVDRSRLRNVEKRTRMAFPDG